MCFIYKRVLSNIRNNFFLIFGLFLGVALSSFMSQIIQNKCLFTSDHARNFNREQSVIVNHDDYDPVINLAGKPLKAQKIPRDFQRPRYYKTELGIREKLLMAVLTSPITVKDYGVTFNATTHHLVDKIVFFMESERNKSKSDVRWNGVVQFSDSRLFLKPFHALKYLADNFLDDFDYFFLVRDKTYVRGRELNKLTRKLSVSEMVHGGTHIKNGSTDFCSLNSGILLSNSILHKVAGKLDWCVKNAVQNLDDINLGKCIIHSTGVPCKSEIQGLTFSSFELSSTAKDVEFKELSGTKAFNGALTLWPVRNSRMLFKLHAYFAKVDILERRRQIASMRHKISQRSVVLPDNSTVKTSWPIGIPPPLRSGNRFDLLRWDYFNEEQIFLKSDFNNICNISGADLIDIKNIVNASVEYGLERFGPHLKFVKLLNGYRRFDPSRGMDYIVDLIFTDIHEGREVHKRLEICKPLGKVELIPMPYVTENARVNLIVVVDEDNKKEIFKFLDNYVSVCMEKKEKTFLMLVFVYKAEHPGKGSKDDVFAQVKKSVVKHCERFKKDNNKIAWLSVKLPQDNFTTGRIFPEGKSVVLNSGILRIALLDLVVKRFEPENLILYSTSNMEIRQDYLNRVRMNTIKDRQIFSPVPFSEFDPDIIYGEDLMRPKEMDINRNYGHYDTLNTEHISFYVKDYRDARKDIEEYVPIVHTDKDLTQMMLYFKKKLEKLRRDKKISNTAHPDDMDVHFIGNLTKISIHSTLEMFLRHKDINVLRGVEPGLRLRHNLQDCRKISNADDLLMPSLYTRCVETRNFNSGSRSQLAHFILEFLNGRNKL